MNKALVLSSGGVDSTTCVGVAVDRYGSDNVSTVSVFYGQKHDKELKFASLIAEYYKVRHYVLDLSEVMRYSNCSLLAHSTDQIKHETYADQIVKDGDIVTTYVPFRNGLMLSAVAALALSIYPNDAIEVFIGAHADDVAGNAYADCSIEFTDAIGKAIFIGTYGKVTVVAPFVDCNKAGVVKEGLRLGVPYELTWSCYEGGKKPCGTCATCIDRAKAFEANNVKDPALKGVWF